MKCYIKLCEILDLKFQTWLAPAVLETLSSKSQTSVVICYWSIRYQDSFDSFDSWLKKNTVLEI